MSSESWFDPGLFGGADDHDTPEKSLHESEAFLETIIESEPQCVKLIGADGTLIRMNRAGLEMIQADSFAQVKGRSVYPLIAPAFRDAFRKITQEVFEGKPGNLEFQMVGLKGRTLWLETNAMPLRNRGNKIVALLGITRNITEHRKAEEVLKASEQRYRDLVDNARDVIYTISPDGTITSLNPVFEAITGFSRDEVVGRNFMQLIHPDDLPSAMEHFRRVLGGEAPPMFELHILGKSGEYLVGEFMATPQIRDGGVVGMLGIGRDVTDRKWSEEQLLNVVKGVTGAMGDMFFRSLVEHLAKALGVDYAFIAEILEENPDRVRTVAMYADGRIVDNVEYDLKGTPCENVAGKCLCTYPSGVQQLFPQDSLLKEMGIGSYSGTPLRDSTGYARGILVVLHRQPLRNRVQVESMMKIFAARAAAELERTDAERKIGEKSLELTMNLEAQSAINALLRIPIENRTMDEVLGRALEVILSVSWLSSVPGGGAVFLAVEGEDRLILKAERGMGGEIEEECAVVPFGKCLCGKAAVSQSIEFGGSADDRHEIRYEGMKPHRQYSVPVLFSGKTLGVLNVRLGEGHRESRIENEMLYAIANALAGIIRRKQVEEDRDRLINELQGLFTIVSHSQREWQETFDSITDVIFLSDLDFTITRVNRAAEKVLDMPLIQILGKKCHELIHGAAMRPDFCCGCRTVETGKVTVAEVYVPHLNRDIEVRVIPRFDKNDQLMGLVHVIRDMTEHKKLEEQLAQAQKMEAVGQLAGGVAHDFNNILTSIIGCGNLLQMKLGRETPLATYINYILDASHKGASLVRGLLAFSRKEMFYPAPVDLNETIRELELFVRRTVTEDIELRMDLTDEVMTIVADKTQMGQVLINLVANARDAMPAGGLVHVTTERFELEREFAQLYGSLPPGVYARISVSDSGTGIDEKTRERIFDPFFTTKEVGKGTGLGLSIIYGIIKQHNGHIMVDSTQGIGTTVHMYLPIVRADGDREEAKELPFVRGGNETILFAEDDSIVRSIVKDLLREFGYEVIEAADGEDAVHKFIEHRDRISLTVLDVIMPGMNGKEAYDRIKSLQPGAKTLFMSGYASDILQSRFIHEDGLHFVQKPVSPVKLLAKIRQLLDM